MARNTATILLKELPLLVLLAPDELILVRALRVMDEALAERFVDMALEGAHMCLQSRAAAGAEVIPFLPSPHRRRRRRRT